jgi:hypothetical protein
MTVDVGLQHDVTDSRARLAQQLAELQKLHIALAASSQSLKAFSNSGTGLVEIKLAYEMLEQYIAISDAFLENMRGRFDARLGVLRRAEPQLDGKPGKADQAPGHTVFWLEFSRLTSVLRRIARRGEI